MKFNIKSLIASLAMSGMVLTGCSDSFLEPDPLSFFEPGTTFSTEAGLVAALGQIDRNLVLMTTNTHDLHVPTHTQFLFSDMLLISATDKGELIQNFSTQLIPSKSVYSSASDDVRMHACIWFWNEFYSGIKYANTVIEYAPKVEGLDQDILNGYLGRAYFHRAFRYYGLVHMFQNVPLITQMPQTPKRNYTSTSREAILEMIEKDMEFAVEHVPHQNPGSYNGDYPGGFVNQGACRMLLAKIYMARYKYDKAKEQLDYIINNMGYQLMENTFGDNLLNNGRYVAQETWPITDNVIWDLHRAENVFNGSNKETIMGLCNSGNKIIERRLMRVLSPFVFNSATTDPSGTQGFVNYTLNDAYGNQELTGGPQNDWVRVFGRGISSFRPTTWASHTLWGNIVDGEGHDNGDLRHSRKSGNWLAMGDKNHPADLTYNNKDSRHYGEHATLYAEVNGQERLLCNDSIRRWYDVPLYKLYAFDYSNYANRNSAEWRGSQGEEACADTYLYRLAEAYLLRAEVNIYLKQPGLAAEDLNIVRRRAQCEQLYTGNVTIDDVFDERARELYLEEFRHDELVRASFCVAQSGVADRKGRTYSMDDIRGEMGDDTGKTGGSFWYQRTIGPGQLGDDFLGYNNGVTYSITANVANISYTMGKHNIFWPIPEFAIEDNDLGTLAQNFGYFGYDASQKVFSDYEEALQDEIK